MQDITLGILITLGTMALVTFYFWAWSIMKTAGDANQVTLVKRVRIGKNSAGWFITDADDQNTKPIGPYPTWEDARHVAEDFNGFKIVD